MKHSTDDETAGKASKGKHAASNEAAGATRVMDASPFSPVEPVSPAGGRRAKHAVAEEPAVEKKPRDPKRTRKIALIACGSVIAVLAVVYIAVSVFFMGHFFPNTSMGGRDISLESRESVEQMVTEDAQGYELEVSGFGLSFSLSSADIGLDVDSGQTVDAMLSATSPWAWPVEVFRSRDVGESLVSTFDATGMNDIVRSAVDEHNATATPPTDATIEYSEAEQRVVVKPESLGTQLDSDAVVSSVDKAVAGFERKLTLTDSVLVRPSVTSDDERLQAAADQASSMVTANMGFTLGGSEVARLDGSTITSWITVDENFNAALSDEALTAWANELATSCSTTGTERTYTRPDGKVVTVSGGDYGWSVDTDALVAAVRDGVAAGSQETIEVPCTQTAYAYGGVGAADWGSRYVDIDLSEQYVRFYDNGTIIWESACISGTPDGVHDTPTGVFSLNAKQSPAKLVGYENGEKIYESEVTFWMPFDGNVIGLHDATWQPDFGGSMYANGYGSHGCVNLSYSAAQSLYGIIQEGDVVISHY